MPCAICLSLTWLEQYATECYCGDAFTGGSTTTQDGDCSMKCGGNATEYCGAGNRLSVYAKQT